MDVAMSLWVSCYSDGLSSGLAPGTTECTVEMRRAPCRAFRGTVADSTFPLDPTKSALRPCLRDKPGEVYNSVRRWCSLVLFFRFRGEVRVSYCPWGWGSSSTQPCTPLTSSVSYAGARHHRVRLLAHADLCSRTWPPWVCASLLPAQRLQPGRWCTSLRVSHVYADMVLSIGARCVQQYFMGKGAIGFYEISLRTS